VQKFQVVFNSRFLYTTVKNYSNRTKVNWTHTQDDWESKNCVVIGKFEKTGRTVASFPKFRKYIPKFQLLKVSITWNCKTKFQFLHVHTVLKLYYVPRVREVWSSNPRLARSCTCCKQSATASTYTQSSCAALSRRWAPWTHYTFRRNTTSIMKN